MNKYLTILIVLVGTAVLANGAPIDSSTAQQQQQQADFNGLAKYLASTDATELKDNINNLNGGVKRAAELYVELSEAQDCNDDVLLIAREATKSGLIEAIGKQENAAALKPLVANLNKLLNTCVSYIDTQIESRVSSADLSMKKFLALVNPIYNEWSEDGNTWNPVLQVQDIERKPKKQFKVDDKSATPFFEILNPLSYGELQLYLRRLANVMAPKDKYQSAGDIERVLDNHLVKPCKRFEATFGPLFEGWKAMRNLIGGPAYLWEPTTQSMALVMTHNTCEAALLLDGDDNASRQKLGYTKTDVAQNHTFWPLAPY